MDEYAFTHKGVEYRVSRSAPGATPVLAAVKNGEWKHTSVLGAELLYLASELRRKSDELNAARSSNSQLGQQLLKQTGDLKRRLEAVEAENRILRARLDAVFEENRDKMSKIVDLQAEVETLRRQNQEQRGYLDTDQEEFDRSRLDNDMAQEIIAELSAALAVGHGEDLTPCAAPCPGHLGPKARAAVDEALGRWRSAELEAAKLREVLIKAKARIAAARKALDS